MSSISSTSSPVQGAYLLAINGMIVAWIAAILFHPTSAGSPDMDLPDWLFKRALLDSVINPGLDYDYGLFDDLRKLKLSPESQQNSIEEPLSSFDQLKKSDMFIRHVRSMMLDDNNDGRHICSGRKHKALGCDDAMANGWMRMLNLKKNRN